MITLVVARAANGTIGREGELPWHLPADMRHFKELTSGHTVLMGRKTFLSLPEKYRPLPDRRNLVLSSDPHFEMPGAVVFHDLPSALAACGGECFVIGGGVVFEEVLPLADRVCATEIEQQVEGDAFFPELAPSQWSCVRRGERMVEGELSFSFATYERGGARSLYDLSAARSTAQRERMERLEANGICVFCPEHVAEHQPEPVEHTGRHWYVTKNHYPYDGTAAHYLIVTRRHVTSFDELPDEAGAELWSIRRMLKAQLEPAALATVERSGNMLYNGGSVAHLHVHLVALEPSPATTVRFRVSAYSDSERPA